MIKLESTNAKALEKISLETLLQYAAIAEI
jgi:hypothetical protein